MRQIILEDLSPEKRMRFLEEQRKARKIQDELIEELKEFEKVKYRGEQRVVTKVNNIIASSVVTKTDYLITRKKADDKISVTVKNVGDNITEIFPDTYKAALDLVNDVELVKSDLTLEPELDTGKIKRIVNHSQVVRQWVEYRNKLQSSYGFFRSEENKKNMDQFIKTVEENILDEKKLIAECGSKMIYFVLFDKYLVTTNDLYKPYTQDFYSQLFQPIHYKMNVEQEIVKESKDLVLINREGKVKEMPDVDKIRKIYDTNYKPSIGFQYSKYNAMFQSKIIINEADNTIENAEVAILEEIVNNIELTISYNLRKIKE
jgi:metal-sulfur cluster biosynthetic enzyme